MSPIISICFSRRSRAANSAVSGLIWPNFELIRDLIVHVTCKNEEDPIKMKLLKCSQRFLHYNGDYLLP